MDRQIVYPGQIPLETDMLNSNKYALIGLSKLAAAILGTSTLLNGLACTPDSPASLNVSVAAGEIYSLQNVDGTAYSSLAADTTHQIVKQGIRMDAGLLSCPAPGTAGQSINYLIQVTYTDTDSGATVLPYYNASNPTQAYSGPNNSGTAQNTVRQGVCTVAVKAGVAATTGTQTTPAPDAGYVGAWVVTVANGQTTITSGNIALYSGAPFITETLTQKISQATGDARYALAGSSQQIPVRQTVLAGPDDTNGLPTFLPATSASLAVTSQNVSSSAPFVVTAANGSGANGDSNFVWSFTTNLTWSGLTNSATNFLYVNAQTGALGFTTLAPVYQWGGTPSVTAGQATYNIQEGKMYLGNGTTAPATPIVFVGEAVASGGTITSTVAYSYRGQYISAYTTPLPGVATAVLQNSNIGLAIGVNVGLEMECVTAEQGYSVGDIVDNISVGNASFDWAVTMLKGRNTTGFTSGSTSAFDLTNKTTGVVFAPTAANWKYRVTAKRSW